MFAVFASATADPIELAVKPVVINPEDPDHRSIGRLRYLGGLELESPDRRFGGLSGLIVSPDGHDLTAVSDSGWWFTARLAYDATGHLVGLSDGRLAPLLDPNGRAVAGKTDADAEALTRLADGGLAVAFERNHRLWRYPPPGPGERPTAMPVPADVRSLPSNGGLEAVAAIDGDRLLALSEKSTVGPFARGWLFGPAGTAEIRYRRHADFRPTDMARLDDGTVLVLERAFGVISGLKIRLTALDANSIAPGARLTATEIARFEPPLLYDNFEGLAARAAADGSVHLYLLSDDNFNAAQSTYLFQFALNPR